VGKRPEDWIGVPPGEVETPNFKCYTPQQR
jgi:hypothetical protein